jgi:hypothetical protein
MLVAETKQELVEAVREISDLRKAQDRERARHQEVLAWPTRGCVVWLRCVAMVCCSVVLCSSGVCSRRRWRCRAYAWGAFWA